MSAAGAYRRAQEFKERYRRGSMDQGLRAALRLRIGRDLVERGFGPLGIDDAIDSAMGGMLWLTAMAEQYGMDMEEMLAAPEAIVSNVEGNLHGFPIDRTGVEVGVGAGYFTGLLVGLLISNDSP